MASATTAKKTAAKRPAKKTAAPARPNHTTARHLRIPDSIWDPAGENCAADGYSGISELVRDLLRDYNAGKRMQSPR